MTGPRTLSFPAVNEHWTLNVTSGDERSTQPAEGEVTLPLRATRVPITAHLLASLEPIPDLPSLIRGTGGAEVAQAGPVDRLAHRLLERRRLESFALLPAGTFTVGTPASTP